jgi:hypothetical protein
VDNFQSNNQASGQASTAVEAEADLEITSFTLIAPADTMAGKPFDVTGVATIHNNGPLSSAQAQATFELTVPPVCAISLVGGVGGGTFLLPASESVALDSASIRWRVRCDQPGVNNFSATGSITPGQVHVTDAVPGNNGANASADTNTKIGACQEDTDPAGNPFQNLAPQLLLLLAGLAGGGGGVPEEQQFPLDCTFNMIFDDNNGGPVDDCEVSTPLVPVPCTVTVDVGIDLMGGTPPFQPGTSLAPIAVTFLPHALEFADDLAVPNGALAGAGSFDIRTDAGLNPNGGECITDVHFNPKDGFDGGLPGNAPDSNLNESLGDPNVWPNDLNAERALVESSLNINPLIPMTLWSRTVIMLEIEGVLELPLNVMIWRIEDPTIQALTQSHWVMVPFPGDAVGPDPAGLSGGDPDADEPIVVGGLQYCTPFFESLTFRGEAGGVVRTQCTVAGSNMGWALMDPNASDFSGDDGTRSNVSPCSLDADGDGLTSEEETYYGTDPLNTDSDADGFVDGSDNCPAQANANQANYDGDRDGDICDPDVDGDGAANTADLCPNTALGVDADANGCALAQVDADADGACNPGAPSGGPPPSCSGTDLCPSTPTGQTADANGCSQQQVDSDADGACDAGAPSGGPPPGCTGTDNCPDLPNDQSDVDGDGYGDACDGCPGVPTQWIVPANDDDCDGFPTADELIIGTLANVACAATPGQNDESPQAWPVDFNDDQRITIQDPLSLKPVFGSTVPDEASSRYDIVIDGLISIQDVLAVKPYFAKLCS